MILLVSFSQNYLSDYVIRNSKAHTGQKIDPEKLAELLGAPQIASSPTPTVLVFWSVTCAPCLEKLKDLPDLSRGDKRVVPINTDAENMSEVAQKILSAALPNQPFYRDRDKILETELEIEYLPTNVYLAADGTIEKIEMGQK